MEPVDVKMSDVDALEITCTPTDNQGNAKALEAGSFGVDTDNDAVILAGEVVEDGTPNADGNPHYIARCDAVAAGTATLTVRGDGDMGAGQKPLAAIIQVVVENAQAENLGLVVRVTPKRQAKAA